MQQNAKDQMAAIREKAKEKFTEEEIDNYINIGKKMASKSVLSALKELIMEGPAKGFDAGQAAKICKQIDALMLYKDCAYLKIEFKETTMQLIVCLCLVDRDHKTEVDIPSTDYVNDLFNHYDRLKQTAIAYWHTFMEENPKLLKKIINYRSDVDFSKLVVDSTNNTTLYWDEKCEHRVGIFCYYIGADGKPFYKKRTPINS